VQFGFGAQFGGDGATGHISAHIARPVDGLHGQQIDHAAEVGFAANGELHGDCMGTQAGADAFHCHFKGGANTVHFIDKADARHLVAIGLSPDGFALRLHTLNRIKNHHAAI